MLVDFECHASPAHPFVQTVDSDRPASRSESEPCMR